MTQWQWCVDVVWVFHQETHPQPLDLDLGFIEENDDDEDVMEIN